MKSVFSSPWLRRSLIALAALAVAVAAVMWFGRSKPVSVVVAEVQRGKVEATIANTRAGAVETCQRAKLSTITGGRIEVLTVKEGDRVKKGQLLMKLWNDDQQAQQALAVAQLEMSRKRVGEACTLAEAAEREAKRQTDLRIKGFVSTAREDAALRRRCTSRVVRGCESRHWTGAGARQRHSRRTGPHRVGRAV